MHFFNPSFFTPFFVVTGHDDSDECQKNEAWTTNSYKGKFCFKGSQARPIEDGDCPADSSDPDNFWCVEGGQKFKSLCKAFASNKAVTSWASKERGCDDQELEWSVQVGYGGSFSGHEIALECNKNYKCDLECEETDINGTNIFKEPKQTNEWVIPVTSQEKSVKTKVSCVYSTSGAGGIKMNMLFFNVQFKAEIEVSMDNVTCEGKNKGQLIECKFKYPIEGESYTAELKIFRSGTTETLSTSNPGETSVTYNVVKNGRYKCSASLRHRTCSPFQEFTANSNQQFQVNETCLIPRIPNDTEHETADPGPENNERNIASLLGLIIGIAVGCVVVVVIAVVVVVYIVLRLKKQVAANPELKACTDKNHKEDSYDEGSLPVVANKILANEKVAEDYIAIKIGTVNDDRKMEYSGKTMKLCRYPEIQCFIHSRVLLNNDPNVKLHINSFRDYKNYPVYLCQAPLKTEFAQFWDLIHNEDIGVVVWVGRMKDGEMEKIHPYIPLDHHSFHNFGQYQVKTTRTYHKRADIIVRYVEMVRMVDKVTRELYFVHLCSWPEKMLPKEFRSTSEVCGLVQLFQYNQEENGLPGLLAHCSTGVESSVAFLATYIGRQMYLDQRKVNIRGIIQYIRKNRHGAFTLPKPSVRQLQVVFGAMKEFVKCCSLHKEKNLLVLPYERDQYENINVVESARSASSVMREDTSATSKSSSKKTSMMKIYSRTYRGRGRGKRGRVRGTGSTIRLKT